MAEISLKNGDKVFVDNASENKLIFIESDHSRVTELFNSAMDGYYNSYGYFDDSEKYIKTINHFTSLTTTPITDGKLLIALNFEEDANIYNRLTELEAENVILRESMEYAEAGRIMFGEEEGES